jgi:transcriptional regulator with XRE-family HTH domain
MERLDEPGSESMELIATRIRRARTGARMTQTQLATAVGVRRSAVAQWETVRGTRPRVEHMAEVAIRTSVNFEWLATGRGPSHLGQAAASPVLMAADIAGNALESRMLELMRRLSSRKQEMACEMVELLAAG